MKEKEHLVATLLLHEIIWKRESALNQLTQGLKVLGVLEAIQKYPDHFRPMFVHPEVPLTGAQLKDHLYFLQCESNNQERARDFFLKYIDSDAIIVCGEGIVHDFIMINSYSM